MKQRRQKQKMRHARRPPIAYPPSARIKANPAAQLTKNDCRALLTDPKVLEHLDEFERRFYGLHIHGMSMPGLAKLTLGDEKLAKITLKNIERKIWLAAPRGSL